MRPNITRCTKLNLIAYPFPALRQNVDFQEVFLIQAAMPTFVASRGKLAGNDVHFENMNWRQTPCARNHAALIGVLSDLRWAFEHISFSFNRPRDGVNRVNLLCLASDEPGALSGARLFHDELFSSLKNGFCHDRLAAF